MEYEPEHHMAHVLIIEEKSIRASLCAGKGRCMRLDRNSRLTAHDAPLVLYVPAMMSTVHPIVSDDEHFAETTNIDR